MDGREAAERLTTMIGRLALEADRLEAKDMPNNAAECRKDIEALTVAVQCMEAGGFLGPRPILKAVHHATCRKNFSVGMDCTCTPQLVPVQR